MFTFAQIAPFATGVLTQLVGSAAQHYLLREYENNDAFRPSNLRLRLQRDGDRVQLAATATAVITSALILREERQWFFWTVAAVSILTAIVATPVLKSFDVGLYERYRLWIFTPVCVIGIILCVAGGAFALLTST